MEELSEHPLAQALREESSQRPSGERSRSLGGDARVRTGAALFAQLVWAHHRWERHRSESGDSDPVLEQLYLEKLAEFQEEEGRLEHVYWSTKNASAVAMTVKAAPPGRLHRLRLSDRDDVVQLHRLTDWVTRDTPHIADLLQECDLLAIRVGEVLRGTSERIAMRWILGIEAHLLGAFERTDGLPDADAELELVERQRRQLCEVEAYYHRAASKAGRIVYVSGMLMGVLIAAALGVVAGFLLWSVGLRGDDLQLPLLCYGAGALGALVSAMSRMGSLEHGRFNIDFELGRPLMRRLGVYRPFVGAVVGVALYFLLASGILDITVDTGREPYYFGFAAFLSGFSERFATVVFGAAERRLAPGHDGDQAERPAAGAQGG